MDALTKGVGSDVKKVVIKISIEKIVPDTVKLTEDSVVIKNTTEATNISPLTERIWSDMTI